MYHRYGCHLCDEMLEMLEDLRRERGFDLSVVDVDADQELVRRFNHKVPVLVGADEEICHYELSMAALDAFLHKHGQAAVAASNG